ncbi:hypothetical protein [Dietzia sp. Alg238-R159]|uniref:hypothetical protein n=1 Tax=Dietzia sp. Alg238-R159 TaxID=2305986 RepID=UPI0013D2CE25|nr:hypothetical protein [Dietzia sp. Alg238-R159]
MRKIVAPLAGLAVAATALVTPAVGHAAEGTTTVTVNVPEGTGGNLSVTVAGSVSLLASLTQADVSSGIGTVTGVSDNRTNVRPRAWTASVSMTPLTAENGTDTIPSDKVFYRVTGPTWDSNGTRENLASDWVSLGQPTPVFERAGQTYSVVQYTSWTPQIKVEFPTIEDASGNRLPAVAAGRYTGTLTTSVA